MRPASEPARFPAKATFFAGGAQPAAQRNAQVNSAESAVRRLSAN